MKALNYSIFGVLSVLVAAPNFAHALDHTTGTAYVDSYLDVQTMTLSHNMHLEITGEAAQQIYDQLQLPDGETSVKVGKNIVCRKLNLMQSGNSQTANVAPRFSCELSVNGDGTVSVNEGN